MISGITPRWGLRERCMVILTLLLCSSASRTSFAQQDPPDIIQGYTLTVNAIGRQDYETARKLVNAIIKEYGNVNEGKELYGPVYGHWFYLRGLAYIGLKKYEEASADFKTCYDCTLYTAKVLACKKCFGRGRVQTTMPIGQRDKDGRMPCPTCGGIPYTENLPPNLFRMHALVQWGNCRMILEDYAEAVKLYKKVLAEDRNNRLNRTWKQYVSVNLGRSLILSDQVEEGYQYVINVLDEPRFSLSLKQIIFQILADDWSTRVESDRVRAFLAKYRHVPLSDRTQNRIKRNPNFFYLANLALEKGDPLLALNWLRLIAHPGTALSETETALNVWRARQKTEKRADRIKTIEAEIAEREKARNKMKQNLWTMMAGNGMAHFMIRNFGASFVLHRNLSDHAPANHKNRPEFLHNTVVSAVQIDDWGAAYTYGKMFLNEFPDHELKPNVVRVLVEIVFINGDYQEAYDLASDIRADLKPGDDIRDIPDFIFGASAYQLAKYEEAEIELEAYFTNYPEPKRKELGRYFLGSTKVKRFKWQEATDIFDPFLEEYPSSAVTSSVLYQNALCKFMLDDNDTALPLVARLLKEYPTAEEVPAGWNLRGDIQTVLEADFDSAIATAYINAITTSAQYPGQEEIAAYARWQLMMNLASFERWEEAGKYFDEFQEVHPDSAYKVDMLIGALETLVNLDRTEEALQRQETFLYDNANADPASDNLGALFGTYLDFLRDYYAEDAMTKLQGMYSSPKSSTALRAWSQIGQIEMLEKEDGDREKEIETMFRLFSEGFEPSQHANYVIIRLARWYNATMNQPEQAAPLYAYVIANRAGTSSYELALLDQAQMDAKSENKEDRDRARQSFERLLAEFDSEEINETANVGVSRLLMQDGQYTDALPRWEAYMDNANWTKFSAEANYNYALCLDNTGSTDDALVVYINTYNAFPGHADFSTASYLRAALIMKEKGDDLKAMLILRDMLTRLQNIEHPNKDKGMQLFQKWRENYTPEKEGKK